MVLLHKTSEFDAFSETVMEEFYAEEELSPLSSHVHEIPSEVESWCEEVKGTPEHKVRHELVPILQECPEKRGGDLHLRGVGLTTFFPGTNSFATCLKTLNFSQNLLKSIPSSIHAFASLQSLDLSRNKLRSLPPEIGELAALQFLDLRTNKLESLPNEIRNLTGLRMLDLSDNRLQTLTSAIEGLKSLQWLHLSRNRLKKLPMHILALRALTGLYINGNPLEVLSKEVIMMQKLDVSTLDLSETPLQKFSVNDLIIKSYEGDPICAPNRSKKKVELSNALQVSTYYPAKEDAYHGPTEPKTTVYENVPGKDRDARGYQQPNIRKFT